MTAQRKGLFAHIQSNLFRSIALFIWFAENIGTFAAAWVYPNQKDGWAMVSPAKLGSWFLLMILSYAMVAAVHGVVAYRGTAPAPSESGAKRQPA